MEGRVIKVQIDDIGGASDKEEERPREENTATRMRFIEAGIERGKSLCRMDSDEGSMLWRGAGYRGVEKRKKTEKRTEGEEKTTEREWERV